MKVESERYNEHSAAVHAEGREAWREGRVADDNPHQAGTEDRLEWYRGFNFERSFGRNTA